MPTSSPPVHVALPYADVGDDHGGRKQPRARAASVRRMARARQRVLDELYTRRDNDDYNDEAADAAAASGEAQVTAYVQWRSYCRASRAVAADSAATASRKRLRDTAADTDAARRYEQLLSQWVDAHVTAANSGRGHDDDGNKDDGRSATRTDDELAARLRAVVTRQLQCRGDVVMQRLQRMQTQWCVLRRAIDDVNAVRCREQRDFSATLRGLRDTRRRAAVKVRALAAVLRRVGATDTTRTTTRNTAKGAKRSSLLAHLDA